jgi:hypothetical protein
MRIRVPNEQIGGSSSLVGALFFLIYAVNTRK